MNENREFSASEWIDFLNTRLNAALEARPIASQAPWHLESRRFSPSLAYGRHFCPPMPTARPAAVMILLEPLETGWHIPLTVRPNHLPDHPGQVCLPGGRLESGESVIEAAEREFCEELGFDAFPAQTLGTIGSIYVFNSDFYLTPCIAVVDRPMRYRPLADEVESIVHLPLRCLRDPQCQVTRTHARGDLRWSALGIDCGDMHIWGATAIVLGELIAILRD